MTSIAKIAVVRIAERPDLVPVVAGWLWNGFRFWRQNGFDLQGVEAAVAAATAASGPPQTFVLLVDDDPVGTASLAVADLDSRPDLSPWLAAVFVEPAHRGRGHAARLVAAVEDAARASDIPKLWLYTPNAERLYARVGWNTVEYFDRNDKCYALMCREL